MTVNPAGTGTSAHSSSIGVVHEYARPEPASVEATPRAARVGDRSRTGGVKDIICVLNVITQFAQGELAVNNWGII